MSEDVQSLLIGLLQKNPAERIGTNGGLEEIIAHDWFKDIDFEALMAK